MKDDDFTTTRVLLLGGHVNGKVWTLASLPPYLAVAADNDDDGPGRPAPVFYGRRELHLFGRRLTCYVRPGTSPDAANWLALEQLLTAEARSLLRKAEATS